MFSTWPNRVIGRRTIAKKMLAQGSRRVITRGIGRQNPLRQAVLNREADPTQNIPQPEHGGVHCVLMDWGTGHLSVASLAVFRDGTVSLYKSRGSSLIGLEQHATVRAKAAKFYDIAVSARDCFGPAQDYPLPKKGQLNFYLVTHAATFTSGAIQDDDLVPHRHPLFPAAHAAQDLLGEIEMVNVKSLGL